MKIGLLTSSRADFGIYYPLARNIQDDPVFDLEIIAFGTHLSERYGYTLTHIEQLGFEVRHKIETLPEGDKPVDISMGLAKTISSFAKFWENNKYDLVLTLGDRFEMFAAVTAASPFNIKFAHIHAGETTLGAIDNAYRHSISHMSEYLFVTTKEYQLRGEQIIQNKTKVFNVGALSIDNLIQQELYSYEEFYNLFGIKIEDPFILSTFHPETISLDKNETYIDELICAFNELNQRYRIIITMPNADTMGLLVRSKLEKFGSNNDNVHLVESFGIKGYLTCMKYCSFLLGNTSSGFVEAAFFPKWVINLGNRQNGRIRTPNIIDCMPEKNEIIAAIKKIEQQKHIPFSNIYGEGNTANKIVNILKKITNE